MKSNYALLRKAAIDTQLVGTNGLLAPEQARQFIQQTFDATPLSPMVRHEMREAKTGIIHKIGVKPRILRKKVEGIDAQEDGSIPIVNSNTGEITGYRAQPFFDTMEYATTSVRLPWEITEDLLRENIEKEGLAQTVTDLMTRQLGVDLEDIYLNGDTGYAGTEDANFLTIKDGWVKKILDGGHVFDATAAEFGLGLFFEAANEIPTKYQSENLRWLMSPSRASQWQYTMSKQNLINAGTVTDDMIKNPAGYPIVTVPALSNDKVILADPRNLVVINTYNMVIRETVEGREAIMRDMRFYIIHLDFDVMVEEYDATLIMDNLPDITFA